MTTTVICESLRRLTARLCRVRGAADAPPMGILIHAGYYSCECDAGELYLPLSASRKAIASSSTRTASMTGTTGRASNTKAGNIEQNL